MTTPIATSPPEAPTARPLVEQAPPPAATPPGAPLVEHVAPVGQFPDGSPRAAHFATPALAHVAGDTTLVARSVATLITHEPPGARVQVFASDLPPRAEKLSIFDPRYRQRPELEAPPSPAEPAPVDVSPERLAAMRARAARSVLTSSPREHAHSFDALLPATVVREPVPTRAMATSGVPLPSRMPARERPSVLEPRGPTPCLYARERP